MRYAHVEETSPGIWAREREFETDGVPASKPNRIYVPVTVVGFTPFDPTTQFRMGPVKTQDGTSATDTFTVRNKTQQELDDEAEADAQARVDAAIKTAVLYAAERAGDDIAQPAVRQAAFDRAKIIFKTLR